jgi:SHS family lactate transporter-like MFS transporter
VDESPAWQDAHRSRVASVSRESNAFQVAGRALRQHWGLLLYLAGLMTAFNFFSHGTQDLYPSALLEKQRGLSRDTVSNIAIVYNLGAICGGITFGAWSQRLGRRKAIVLAALLALPMIPAWAFATNPWRIAFAAFLMQFCVQGAWGVVPAHLNELSPGSLRGTFPGLAYQLGNLFAASTGVIQGTLAHRNGGDFGGALAWSVAAGAVVLALLAWFGPEARTAWLAVENDADRVEPISG